MSGSDKPAEKPESKKTTDTSKTKTEETAKQSDKNSESVKNNGPIINVIRILTNELHYKQTAENVFEKETKSGNKYKLELRASITESFNNSNFNKFANLIIEEQTKTMEATFTIVNNKLNKSKSYQVQIPFEIDAKGINDILNKCANDFNLLNKNVEQTNNIKMLMNIWKKLDENEQAAFITFYGEKITKALKH